MLKRFSLYILVSLLVISCSKENTGTDSKKEEIKKTLSDAKEIVSFKIKYSNETYTSSISNDTISYILPGGFDLTNLSPTIVISEKSTVTPASGTKQNFTHPIIYTVKAEDNSTKKYVAVIESLSTAKSFYWAYEAENAATSYSIQNKNLADIDTILQKVPYLTNLKEITSKIEISETATSIPASGETLDYSSPVKYIVTAEDGSTKEYLIILDNSLKDLEIEGLVIDDFENVPLGGDINFEVNELNPILDSITVKLISVNETFNLVVKDVNYETKRITATLPNSYRNNRFQLEVRIEHDNIDLSNGFYLFKGTANFVHASNFSDGPGTTILWPKQSLNAKLFLKNNDLTSHSFFLRKNGVDYPFIPIWEHQSFGFDLRMSMPNLPNTPPNGGTDFSFVIKNTDGEQVFDLTNSEGNPIEVIVAEQSANIVLDKIEMMRDGILKVSGDNIYYPMYGSTSKSYIELKTYGYTYRLNSNTVDSNGDLVFDLSTFFQVLQSGFYSIGFKNNTSAFDEVNTGLNLTLSLPESQHSSLEVTEAKLYKKGNAFTPQQLLIKLNQNIEGKNIKKIVTGPNEEYIIESFISYPTTILTGKFSDEDYDKINNERDGYIVIEENGVDYKIYFRSIYVD
ncbi:MAG: hypothetical protein V3U92_18510 [Cellulophaga sp.]